MFKSIKNFFYNMVTTMDGKSVNSKIFVGLLSFVVCSVALFIPSVTHDKFLIYIIFCASCFGMSCYDNKTSFQITKNESNTTTETKTSTSNKTTTTDVTSIVNNTVDKISKKVGKKK